MVYPCLDLTVGQLAAAATTMFRALPHSAAPVTGGTPRLASSNVKSGISVAGAGEFRGQRSRLARQPPKVNLGGP
jgi:hypothetical protein